MLKREKNDKAINVSDIIKKIHTHTHESPIKKQSQPVYWKIEILLVHKDNTLTQVVMLDIQQHFLIQPINA